MAKSRVLRSSSNPRFYRAPCVEPFPPPLILYAWGYDLAGQTKSQAHAKVEAFCAPFTWWFTNRLPLELIMLLSWSSSRVVFHCVTFCQMTLSSNCPRTRFSFRSNLSRSIYFLHVKLQNACPSPVPPIEAVAAVTWTSSIERMS